MGKFVSGTEFFVEDCCNCGMQFAVTRDFRSRRLADHKMFYCPAGHQQYYSGKSDAEKLEDELRRKQRELDLTNQRLVKSNSQRNEVSKSYNKMRERVKNGVCPCCTRSFDNLRRHMQTQHPEFGDHKILQVVRSTYGLTQLALANEIGISTAYISSYENRRPLPAYAKLEIDNWLERSA